MKTLTEQQEQVLGERLAEIFNLRHDREHRDRYLCEGGNKTAIGIARVFQHIVEELEQGVPPHKLFH